MRFRNFDHLLETAFYEVKMDELRKFPSEVELKKYEFPEKCNAIAYRVNRRMHIKKAASIFITFGRTAVLIFFVLLGSTTIIAYASSAKVRAVCAELYTEFIEYVFGESEEITGFDFPRSVGEYQLVSYQDENENMITSKYVKGDKQILVNYFFDSSEFEVAIDSENYNISQVEVGDISGKAFESDKTDVENQILGEWRGGLLRVRSKVSIDELKYFLYLFQKLL